MKMFPYSLIRIAGMNFNIFDDLDWGDSEICQSELESIQKERELLKIKICDQLLLIAQQSSDHKQRNLIQNIRRDIFNQRIVKEKLIQELSGYVPGKIVSAINSYALLQGKYAEKLMHWDVQYHQAIIKTRKKLQDISTDDLLLKGLAFSSQALLKNMMNFHSRDASSFSKKDLDTEYGLLKYASRMSCKTSPFSTFTSMALGKLVPVGDEITSYEIMDSAKTVHGHVRLNIQMFSYLKVIMQEYHKFSFLLPVRLNPTLEEEGPVYRFLKSNRNIETFQKIDKSVVNELIIGFFKVKFETTCNELFLYLNENIAASKKDIKEYIRKLCYSGLIEFNYSISSNDPDWDYKLVDFLSAEKFNIPGIPRLINLLKYLRKIAVKLSSSTALKRSEHILSAYEYAKICFLKFIKISTRGKSKVKEFTVTSFSFLPGQIFYEDTTIDISESIDDQELSALSNHLNDFISGLNVLMQNKDELRKMTAFHRNKYGEDHEVSFLQFYEDYYRDIKVTEVTSKEDLTPVNDPVQVQVNELRRVWEEKFATLIEQQITPDCEEINISNHMIAQVNDSLNLEINFEKGASIGCIIQLYVRKIDGENKLNGVLHGAMHGYGKLFSRFLHVVDTEVLEGLRAFNSNSLNSNVVHIENIDASYHNSNLHPYLFDKEVNIPGGNNSVPLENQLKISDFVVRFNKPVEKIELVYLPDNKNVQTYDLGFLGLGSRSKLFQLLSEFSDATSFSFAPIFSAIRKVALTKKSLDPATDCVLYPRVTLENQIVLRRKQWIIPLSQLPLKNNGEKGSEYFIRINNWRHRLNIPEKVFISVDPERSYSKKGIDITTLKVTRDDYKPQYISFDNVLLVNLFERIIKRVPRILKIEEMLPNVEDLTTLKNKKWVTENIIQWYN